MTEPRRIALNLPVEAVEAILTGLAELPYRTSAPIIEYVRDTAREQLSQPAGPVHEPLPDVVEPLPEIVPVHDLGSEE